MLSNTTKWSEQLSPDELRKLELLKMKARRAYLGTRQGGHLSLKRGHGLEFSDYRKYEIGDNPRYIDWGVYARSERLYIKKFQEEQDISVSLIIDASSSMLVPEAGVKWTIATKLARALSYVTLMQQDNVKIFLLGGTFSPGYYGGRAYHRISDDLQDIRDPLDFESLTDETNRVASGLKSPGICFVFSDFLYETESVFYLLNMLRAKNLDISCIQILGREDVQPFQDPTSGTAIDSESGVEVDIEMTPQNLARYQLLLENHNDEISAFCEGASIRFIRVEPGESFDEVLINKLTATGVLQ